MSTKQLTKSKKGFTIIEVVLVLAIAGLIFLMVFVALPALQRSQRDTQRRDDVGRLVTAVTTYKANTGDMPGAGTGVTTLNSYLGDFKDPGTSNAYTINIVADNGTVPTAAPADGTMVITLKTKCNGTLPTRTGVSGKGYFSVITKAENGGSICQDNS